MKDNVKNSRGIFGLFIVRFKIQLWCVLMLCSVTKIHNNGYPSNGGTLMGGVTLII